MATATQSPNGVDKVQSATIMLPRLQRSTVIIPIVGQSPVILGAFGEKAKTMMRDKQTKGVTAKKDLKVPEVEAESRAYRHADGRFAIPSVNFKCAIVDACRFFDSLKMTDARRCFLVLAEDDGQLIPITDGEANIREDFVRNATGVADIRYRYELWPWKATLKVQSRGMALDPQSIINLVDAAGQCGVCEWRPSSPKSSSGIYGMFQVDAEQSIRILEG